MKIEKIVPYLVHRYLLVRVYTDEGIVGNAEAGLWAHHPTVYHAIEELSDYYVGQDPTRMEHHYQVVSRDTHFMGAVLSAAMSAIDIAMWDILGKSVGLPVYQLLGGKCRDRVRVFANVNGNTLDERAASAVRNVEQGYTAMRTTPFFNDWVKETPTKAINTATAIVKTIREAVGYNIDLGLEIHRNLTPEEAIVLAHELQPYRILFYEDPLAPESLEAMTAIAPHIHLPMATGERFYNIYQFKELIDSKTVSLIRPDVSLVGGYTQIKKVAAMAEAAFIGIFPHLMGSPVNIATFIQFVASIPNYFLMESLPDSDAFNEIVTHPPERDGGYFMVPNRPGIGLDIDEAKLSKFPYKPKKITGSFRADGSVIS